MISNEARIAIFVYIISVLLILMNKRDLVVNENGEIIPFGFASGQSILSLPVLIAILAVGIYYLVITYIKRI